MPLINPSVTSVGEKSSKTSCGGLIAMIVTAQETATQLDSINTTCERPLKRNRVVK